MKNAILVHGWADEAELHDTSYPTASNSHWFPWLSKQLMARDIHTIAVEMPNAPFPVYETWKHEFERYDITEDTILVGHSCGGGFLVRWLSEHPDVSAGNVVLVAPWMGFDFGLQFDNSFFDFDVDINLKTRCKNLTIISSDNDMPAVNQSVELLKKKINGIEVLDVKNQGHYTLNDMGTVEFTTLLKLCLV